MNTPMRNLLKAIQENDFSKEDLIKIMQTFIINEQVLIENAFDAGFIKGYEARDVNSYSTGSQYYEEFYNK